MEKKKIDWKAYDRSLKQRGSITFWFSEEAIRAWSPDPTGKRGGQSKFSDLAIETSLSLRLIFKQGLRQTEGLIGSIVDMMKLDIDVPDHSTLSRRGKVIHLSVVQAHCDSSESVVVIVDSTGLKIYGAGEWNANKHGLSKRREWRKLHLTINESTLEIIASSLTDNSVGDPTEVPNLLDQIKTRLMSLLVMERMTPKKYTVPLKAVQKKAIIMLQCLTRSKKRTFGKERRYQ